jgi:hypothetical protein
MPKGNEEAYKEMFEMGQRLVEMAKAGGYDPESEEEPEEIESEDYDMEEDEEEMPLKSMSSKKDKVSSALSLFKR